MNPIVINGDLWRVARVPSGDPRLVDRTGESKLAVTDAGNRTISILDTLRPPMLDKVLLHEVAHAVTVSWHLLPEVGKMVRRGDRIGVEEWSAQMVENHALEAVEAARTALGRPLCVRGICFD